MRLPVLAGAVMLALAAAAVADERDTIADTIASLEGKTVDVEPGHAIAGSNEKARENYRGFLDLVSDDPLLRAEAMRRLADLELEAAEAEQLTSNVEALDRSGFDNAVSLFKKLLETYPDYRRNDTVLYQLARAYEIAGETEEALTVLNELAARYPGTPRIEEIQFRRGEMLFLRKDYEAAEAAYRAVVDRGDASRFYQQSLYKLGWSQFKLGRHEESLDPFFDLLDRKLFGIDAAAVDDQLEVLSRADKELVDDTFRVLSISFSYMEGPQSIASYLARRGDPEYGYVIFMNLGDLYLEKERYVDAAEAYEAFVLEDPYHPKAPLLQVEVIEAYKLGAFPTLVLEGKKSFVERYGMDSPFWQRNPDGGNEAVKDHLKANLNDLAQFYHAEAQKDGRRADYQQAALWYRKYLEYFPGQTDSANTNFLLAEILFESRDFEAATAEYERTAYGYPGHEHSSEAGYAALLSYREHEELLDGSARREWHSRYLDSGLRFADAWPEHAESGAVLTAVADDLFQQKQFDLAIAVAQTVVNKVPPVQESLARTAWTVIAHSQFDLQQFADAERAYYELRPLASEPAAQKEIDDRIASAIYKQGELARDAGDLETAVTHFTRLGQAVPGSAIRETAEYDAAAALINLEAWDRASSVLQAFRNDYPDSRFAEDVTQKLAVTYLESGRSGEAAAEFERIAEVDTTSDELRREALWKAAGLYKTSNESAREEQVLAKIVDRYPNPVSESIEARFRLLELAEKSGDQRVRTERLQELVRADRSAGAERTDRTRYLAAKATLELAEPLRNRFSSTRISQPLADSLKRKKALMEDVLSAYGKAAEYGVAEVTTAATYRLGEVYQQFSRDLMESERPADLDADALEQYDLLLEEQAFPFEEKAIELYEANASRTADGVYDGWVKRSFDALAELVPARYAKLERSEDVVTALF
ncbi:MAG TPA: tetratricopeptide repeat protein [Woeseiaceae bacterium]|nr:tetratricopeptide repeat protein [Woeseiaceae bacterium]